jgi:DNA polymerase-3 subunit alpha (Gram-positive type)
MKNDIIYFSSNKSLNFGGEMGRNFVKIKPRKNIFETHGVKNAFISEIYIYEKQKRMELLTYVKSPEHLNELDTIENGIKQKFGSEISIGMRVEFAAKEMSLHSLKLIVDRVIKDLKKYNAISRSFLYFYRVFVENDNIFVELKSDTALDSLINSEVDIKLNQILKKYGVNKFNIKLRVGDFSQEIEQMDAELIEIDKKLQEKATEVRESAKPEPKQANKKTETANDNIICGRDIKDGAVQFKEFDELYMGDTCVVEGEVFKLEKRFTKTGKQLISFNITNYKDSITVKMFAKEDDDIPIKTGIWVKIKGKKQVDKFNNNEDVLFANSINKIQSKRIDRKDDAEEKRVELHAHTKMSDMDSVVDAADLVKQAIDWGHKAIAITDHGVVHSFPFAYKAAKKQEDFKIIFGCEGYLVDDEIQMVKNPKPLAIEEETYVVFDIETTGFDPYKDKIIEIGAVKMKGSKVVERYSSFINPQIPIPKVIEDLTGINDNTVKDAPFIDKVLPEFIEFIGDSTVVAHNANFDVGFISQKAHNLGIEINPTVIDTLQWSRNIRKDKTKHGLKNICNDYGINLENHHRAVDDAEATAEIFKRFINIVIKENAYYLNEVDQVFKTDIKNASTYHIIILVKNQDGLKNLYRLVSEAHLNYFYRRPRIPKSLLKECREGLILGSACEAGEVLQAYLRGKPEAEVEEIARFYDYLEIQPHSNNSFMLDNGSVKSTADLDEMNRYIYKLGKKLDKLIVATGDVHYLNPEDNIYRSVLLYGKGFKDYGRDSGLYFRTTKDMLEEFSYLGAQEAREVVIENPNKISETIEKLQPVPSGFYPPKLDNAEEEVRSMTYEKAYRIYGNPLPEVLEQRIERELNAIIGNGFSVLYLSAQKLVKESLDNGYLVGSRGSVGSSIVAFMMGITEVNALYPHYICEDEDCKYSEFMEREGSGVDLPDKTCPKCGKKLKKDGHSIPFEVFMGFNGDKVPDIDLNFSGEYQSEIHRYTERLFGKENVFKAGTISTLAEKNAYGYVKKYAEETGKDIRSAEMERLAMGCEGVKKTTGQHPGGMIVVPQGHSIYEFCPVQRPANDQKSDSITTHYDYHVMDEQLVKLDILGHDDPTTIKLLQDYTGVDIYDVPLADPDTLKIFSGTEALGVTPDQIGSVIGTYGVPEFGTQFVRQMLVDTLPTTFAELVRISGLSHGTDVWLNNAQDFVRQGQATLAEVISVRDDIMNYLIDSGIEKGTAFKIMEFVRKGMPSKNPDQWSDYSELMKEHKVPDWYIESCRRIKYMFPKGHAVAYVMMAMRIAYFKVHYPLAFYAAYLSRKAEDFDSDFMLSLESVKAKMEELKNEMRLDVRQKTQLALSEIIIEMNARGFEFLGIDIYKSDGFKFVIEDGKIRVPLIALNGLGGAVVENIMTEREIGKFLSYEDLKRRTKTSQTIVEKLKEVNAVEGLSDTNQKSLFSF